MPLPAIVDGPVFVSNAVDYLHCAAAAASTKRAATPKQRDLSEEELQKLLERIVSSKQNQQKQHEMPVTTAAPAMVNNSNNNCSNEVCQDRTSIDSGVSSISDSSLSSLSSLAELELCSGIDKLNVCDKENIAVKKPAPIVWKKHSSVIPRGNKPATPPPAACGGDTSTVPTSTSTKTSHGKWLSPQEYFQLTRLRSTALATKLGGNSCSVLLLDCSEIPRPNPKLEQNSTKGVDNTKPATEEGRNDEELNKLTDGLKDMAIDKKKNQTEEEDTEKNQPESQQKHDDDTEKKAQETGETKAELIDRGPIQAHRNSNAYSPYDMHTQHQRYLQMEQHQHQQHNSFFMNQSPMEYFAMQKQQKHGPIAPYGMPQSTAGNAAFQVHLPPSPEYNLIAQGDAPEARGYCSPPHGYMMDEMHGSPYEMSMVEFNLSMQEQLKNGYVDIVPAASNAPHPEYLYQAAAACDIPGSPDSYASSCFMRDSEMIHHNVDDGDISPPIAPPPLLLQQQAPSPFADEHLSNSELNRILNANAELPDSLSDFILKYSRRYSTDTPCSDVSSLRKISHDDESSVGGLSAAQSPVSAVGDSPPGSGHPSPQPRQSEKIRASASSNVNDNSSNNKNSNSNTSSTANNNSCNGGSIIIATNTQTTLKPAGHQRYKPIRPKQSMQRRSNVAKDRLRATISDKDFETGWAWALRCSQAGPSALYFRDQDGDSLLHIVIWHKDIPKVLGLVEMMMRDEGPPYCRPFDLPNRMDETPLFLAVEKRLPEVAAYLLECGADPNRRTRSRDCDAPIHYAAARGMSEIVATLASCGTCDLNLVNGNGITPLICAVKNHGVIEEESQCLVNNKPTIRTLLKHGADPKIPDAASGKTVLHYAVERMDPDLVEIFRDNTGKEEMLQLVNSAMYNGDTPLHLLSYLSAQHRSAGFTRGESEDELRRKMFLTLVNCGADVTLPNSQGQCPTLSET